MASESKTWMYIGAALAGIFGLTAIASAGEKKRPKFKDLYNPGDTIHAFMGQLVTVRLPRGDYQVAAGQATKIAEADVGANTDVVISIGGAHAAYRERVQFVGIGESRTYYVEIVVTKLPEPAKV